MSKNGENEKALVRAAEHYAIMKQNAAELAQVIQENLGGTGIDIFQLDRVKVPAGGSTTWEIPDLLAEGGSVASKVLEGVIIYFADGNAYWDTAYNGEANPPVCVSEDGLVGVSSREGLGGECASCPLNRFNSEVRPDGTRGRGKACKNMRRLFIMRPGTVLPLLLVVPPTSLKQVRQYFLRLAGAGIPYYGVITKLALVQQKSGDGITYSQIQPQLGARLSPEEIAKIREFRDALVPALKRVTILSINPREDVSAAAGE